MEQGTERGMQGGTEGDQKAEWGEGQRLMEQGAGNEQKMGLRGTE